MNAITQSLLGLTIVIFMVGSLLEVGLKLDLGEALDALRNVRFVALSVLWAFVLCPAFALLLTKIVPLAEPYALGLMFLGMAPCAPFFPTMAEKAGGDLPHIAAFVLVTAFGTVLFMPLATPLLAHGFEADAKTIAKPLLFYIAAPLVAGLLIRQRRQEFADKARPIVKTLTAVNTLAMVGLVLWIYGAEFVQAVGTYAIGVQLVFYATVAVCAYVVSPGLQHPQRSVLALGSCTRNIGAAFAPLIAAPGIDRRAIAMVALAVPLSIVCAAVVARVLARLADSRQELDHSAIR